MKRWLLYFALIGLVISCEMDPTNKDDDTTAVPEPVYKVPEAVDLGLSVKWASWNVGATKPEELGGRFSWGETEVKNRYEADNYRWSYTECDTQDPPFSRNYLSLSLENDVAHVKFGGGWRMPTILEFDELLDGTKCSWTNTTINGVDGYLVTSKVPGYTGNSIFIPRNDSGSDWEGCYWSSTLNGKDFSHSLPYLIALHEKDPLSYDIAAGTDPFIGLYIRPVEESPKEEIPEAVDLGLSVRWASFNVGAFAPYELGEYFAWGDTEPWSEAYNYFENHYKWLDPNTDLLTKYNTSPGLGPVDGKTILEPDDDVAHVRYGDGWRIPTKEEFEELYNNTDQAFIAYNRLSWGILLTSNVPGYTDKSIFIPPAGYDGGHNVENLVARSSYNYWTACLGDDYSPHTALYSIPHNVSFAYGDRRGGLPVRAVRENPVTEIVFDQTDISIHGRDVLRSLTPTIYPATATRKGLEWRSSNETVAIVSEAGDIISTGPGTAVVTATACDGSGVYASCNVTVDVSMNPQELSVDLGLSVRWASMNVGAMSPEECGAKYLWGETERRSFSDTYDYKWGYVHNNHDSHLSKYNLDELYGIVDNKNVLDPEDDAATVQWGNAWRTPTVGELLELADPDNCNWEWIIQNGAMGIRITSKIPGYTGNSIFLPLEPENADADYGCYRAGYWTATLADSCNAYSLGLSSDCYLGVIQGDSCYIFVPETTVRSWYILYIRPVCH